MICFNLCCCGAFSQPEQFSAKVIAVSDGDTIKVLLDGAEVKIRLNGIDCPEKTQDFGEKAKQFTSEHCFGQTVSIRTFTTDRYGRLVADVILSDGKKLNDLLVENGLAWWYQKYAPNNQTLEQLENTARNHRLGLWSQLNPIAPWSFRARDPFLLGIEHKEVNTDYQGSVEKPSITRLFGTAKDYSGPPVDARHYKGDAAPKVTVPANPSLFPRMPRKADDGISVPKLLGKIKEHGQDEEPDLSKLIAKKDVAHFPKALEAKVHDSPSDTESPVLPVSQREHPVNFGSLLATPSEETVMPSRKKPELMAAPLTATSQSPDLTRVPFLKKTDDTTKFPELVENSTLPTVPQIRANTDVVSMPEKSKPVVVELPTNTDAEGLVAGMLKKSKSNEIPEIPHSISENLAPKINLIPADPIVSTDALAKMLKSKDTPDLIALKGKPNALNERELASINELQRKLRASEEQTAVAMHARAQDLKVSFRLKDDGIRVPHDSRVSWDVWHERFSKMYKEALLRKLEKLGNPAGSNTISITVTRSGRIEVFVVTGKDASFNSACLEAYQSLDRADCLKFPDGSKRRSFSFFGNNNREATGPVSGVNSVPLIGDYE